MQKSNYSSPKTAYIKCWNVEGECENPKGILVNSNKLRKQEKEVFLMSISATQAWRMPLLQSSVVNTLALPNIYKADAIEGKG